MFERYFKGVQPHINIEKIEAEVAFLPGPPERALELAKQFSTCEKVTEQREFVTYKGEVNGKNVCVTSTGIGCPSAAIVVEELANCGVKVFIRVGTTGAIQKDIELGEVIIPEAAVREDGTTKEYINEGYPAVASSRVVEALRRSAEEAEVSYHVGIVRTNDAFYGEKRFGEVMERYSRAHVLSFEMECSAIFTVARLRGLHAGAILGVVGNLAKNEHAYRDTKQGSHTYKEKAKEAIKNAIHVAVGAVKYLGED
ncbi:MAG: nucleoside phosphorylase [archaeon]|nr:nucleoside phosphorylase [archaeon]